MVQLVNQRRAFNGFSSRRGTKYSQAASTANKPAKIASLTAASDMIFLSRMAWPVAYPGYSMPLAPRQVKDR